MLPAWRPAAHSSVRLRACCPLLLLGFTLLRDRDSAMRTVPETQAEPCLSYLLVVHACLRLSQQYCRPLYKFLDCLAFDMTPCSGLVQAHITGGQGCSGQHTTKPGRGPHALSLLALLRFVEASQPFPHLILELLL